jgi:hypothetical protein
MGAEKAIIAGTDILLSTKYGQNASLAWMRCDTLKTSDDGIIAMKVAVKHILYSYASSALNRDVVAEEADTSNVTGLYIGLNIVGYGGAVILLALFVFLLLRDIRSHSVKVETIAEDPNSTTN